MVLGHRPWGVAQLLDLRYSEVTPLWVEGKFLVWLFISAFSGCFGEVLETERVRTFSVISF